MHSPLEIHQMDQPLLPLDYPAATPIWRPIHYLGSKLRIVESLREHIADLSSNSETISDLFAGSGTVSLALASSNKVVASDIQEYSRVLCSALLKPAILNKTVVQELILHASQTEAQLENCLAPILEIEAWALAIAAAKPSLLCDLSERGPLLIPKVNDDELSRAITETNFRLKKQPLKLLTTTYFGGVYFSYRQAFQLDCLMHAIEHLPTNVHDTCFAAVLSTASTIVNSIGKQFAQPMRPRRKDGTIKTHIIKQMCRDRSLDTFSIFSEWISRYQQLPQTQNHQVVRGDYRDVLRDLHDISVVYADPPYTRDHYSRFYHVLETLSLRDSPYISRTSLKGKGSASRGLYREHRHQSPFCIKSQAPNAFRELFKGCRKIGSSVLVSYSPFVKDGHPRLMTVEAVQQIAKEHYRHVRVEPAQPVMHSKLNKSELHLEASANAEVFIICRI